MNKISKKIVSLVTMAAFALTLVPAAAFAAPVGTDGFEIALTSGVESEDVYLNSANKASVDLTVELKGKAIAEASKYGQIGFFAALKGTKTPASGVDFTNGSVPLNDYNDGYSNGNIVFLTGDGTTTTGTETVTVGFDRNEAGQSYDICAFVYTSDMTGADKTEIANKMVANAVEVGTINVKISNASATRASSLVIDGSHSGVATIEKGEAEPFYFDVRTNDGAQTNDPLVAPIYVWVEDANGNVVKDAVISKDGNALTPADGISTITNDVYDNDTFTVMIPTVGEGYSLHASAENAAPNVVTQLTSVSINVTEKTFTTEYLEVTDVEGSTAGVQPDNIVNGTNENEEENTTYWTVTMDDNVTPNDLKEYTVEGTAWADDANQIPAENEELTITTQNANLTINDADGKVKTDADGNFEFTFSIKDTGTGYITIYEPNDQEYAVLKVTQNAMAPVDIETVKDGGIMLAGTDDQYIYNQVGLMTEAVQFNITDAYDRDAYGPEVIDSEKAALNASTNPEHNDFIDVVAPEGSSLKDEDINLAWDSENAVYTLKYVGKDAVHDLIPGEYTVTVSLNNGKDATATFTLAEFQGAESLDISMTAEASQTLPGANENAITAIDDQVALGQNVTGYVYLVDAQGLKIKAPASNLSIGVNGAAVATDSVANSNPFTFTTVPNIPANQSVIGSVITVSAYDEVNGMYVEKPLNVVSNYGDETLKFDPTQGPVGENNGVDVTVVDANDKLSKVNGTMTAYIADQSNADAKITLRANEAVKDGAGKLYLESDKAGTVDVVVAVKADNGEIYANTLTYTFGDEDPYAGSYIVMTIGSDQYLINGEMFDGSADNLGAPYIDSAWRTMVPVRVLAESFGANVDYADNVVTIVDGDTTVVMNIGEETYTVNGEEKAMDTAAVIGDDDRTYVPVRFVAEALGYSVTPLYDANGLTSSVHFSK